MPPRLKVTRKPVKRFIQARPKAKTRTVVQSVKAKAKTGTVVQSVKAKAKTGTVVQSVKAKAKTRTVVQSVKAKSKTGTVVQSVKAKSKRGGRLTPTKSAIVRRAALRPLARVRPRQNPIARKSPRRVALPVVLPIPLTVSNNPPQPVSSAISNSVLSVYNHPQDLPVAKFQQKQLDQLSAFEAPTSGETATKSEKQQVQDPAEKTWLSLRNPAIKTPFDYPFNAVTHCTQYNTATTTYMPTVDTLWESPRKYRPPFVTVGCTPLKPNENLSQKLNAMQKRYETAISAAIQKCSGFLSDYKTLKEVDYPKVETYLQTLSKASQEAVQLDELKRDQSDLEIVVKRIQADTEQLLHDLQVVLAADISLQQQQQQQPEQYAALYKLLQMKGAGVYVMGDHLDNQWKLALNKVRFQLLKLYPKLYTVQEVELIQKLSGYRLPSTWRQTISNIGKKTVSVIRGAGQWLSSKLQKSWDQIKSLVTTLYSYMTLKGVFAFTVFVMVLVAANAAVPFGGGLLGFFNAQITAWGVKTTFSSWLIPVVVWICRMFQHGSVAFAFVIWFCRVYLRDWFIRLASIPVFQQLVTGAYNAYNSVLGWLGLSLVSLATGFGIPLAYMLSLLGGELEEKVKVSTGWTYVLTSAALLTLIQLIAHILQGPLHTVCLHIGTVLLTTEAVELGVKITDYVNETGIIGLQGVLLIITKALSYIVKILTRNKVPTGAAAAVAASATSGPETMSPTPIWGAIDGALTALGDLPKMVYGFITSLMGMFESTSKQVLGELNYNWTIDRFQKAFWSMKYGQLDHDALVESIRKEMYPSNFHTLPWEEQLSITDNFIKRSTLVNENSKWGSEVWQSIRETVGEVVTYARVPLLIIAVLLTVCVGVTVFIDGDSENSFRKTGVGHLPSFPVNIPFTLTNNLDNDSSLFALLLAKSAIHYRSDLNETDKQKLTQHYNLLVDRYTVLNPQFTLQKRTHYDQLVKDLEQSEDGHEPHLHTIQKQVQLEADAAKAVQLPLMTRSQTNSTGGGRLADPSSSTELALVPV